MNSKIATRDRLKDLLARRGRRRVVFTNGCFDILHRGHVAYLDQAKRQGDILVVGLNSDASVRRLKGPRRPINTQRDRAEVLAALTAVDYVTIFAEDTPLDLIKTLQPDVLVKGGDWPVREIVGADVVRARKGKVLALPFIQGRSTTALLKKIATL